MAESADRVDAVPDGGSNRHRLPAGTRLGPSLVIERLLGQGGMGVVYLARDELLDRRVAVKLLFSGRDLDSTSMRTLLEARAAARVVHPHVAAVHAIGEFQGAPYIEMEWVDGRSLRAVLQPGRPDVATAATWIAQLAAALTHAHDVGVVHCDVKPENVIVREAAGRPGSIKLVDFGLARSRQDGQADRALSQGTLAYLAPELLEGAPSAASDQFALAMLAAEMLLDARPARPHWTAAPVLPMTTPLPLQALTALVRAFDAKPARRFASAAAFADALLRGLGVPNARAALVGMVAEVDDPGTVSTELPAPPIASLAGIDAELQVLATLALLPQGYPGALAHALGVEPDERLLARLAGEGRIDGVAGEWRLARPEERESVLARLAGKHRRQVCSRVAGAIEACGPKRESVREDATRLYMQARRLPDAARLAFESAADARLARERDHHLARAASLLTSTLQPLPWADALLQRCEWALRCGWLPLARGPLAEVQGVLADAHVAVDHPLSLRATVAAAEIRALAGDLHAALLQLRHAERAARTVDRWLWLLIEARTVALLSRTGDRAAALQRGEAALARADAQGDRGMMALGQLHGACGTAALRNGDTGRAEALLQRALAIQAERGDGLQVAAADVMLGNVHAARDNWLAAEKHYRQAEAMLAPLGTIELTAIVQTNLGDCWTRLGKPWQATRALWQALAVFDEHGLTVHQTETLQLLASACDAVGDSDGAAAARQRTSDLARRVR